MVTPAPQTSHDNTSVTRIISATSLVSKVTLLTDKLGLPHQALERIAEKASELLDTAGAIFSAPGYTAETKMVKSHSAKRPHLVTPKKKGNGYACDDECPQYKSAKVCSHTLATAVVNDRLNSLVSSFDKVKRAPNLTKLVTTTMPKGRGCKGSKAPTKHRPSVPVQHCFELNPSIDSPGPSVQVGVSSSANTSIAITTPCHSDAPGGVTPMQSTTTFDDWYASMPPPPSMPTWSPSTSYPMDTTSAGTHPSRLHFVSGNISVCHGCKGKYQKLAPPFDHCLQHEKWRTFTTAASSTPKSRFGNVYYHCNIHCVRAIWPTFLPTV